MKKQTMKKEYGLLGYPLSHSFSKQYFENKFRKENIDATYVNYEFKDVEDIFEVIENNESLVGFNVTIPHKESIMPLLDSVDSRAFKAGAVNVVKIERTEKFGIQLVGYNTDVTGFTNSIKPLLRECHKKALILGTGGAAKAVKYSLCELGIDNIYVSRTTKNGFTINYDELTKYILDEHKVIVNCTPVGTYPNVDEYIHLPYEYIGKEHLLFDLVYNPATTAFMKKGVERGATVKNGQEMLELQAEAAWNIWNI
ncbi:MAG: shikimate dehydrogenase [Bacteroides sp.]|nr:shikimate dehydrogenase [Bacteroides sp.]